MRQTVLLLLLFCGCLFSDGPIDFVFTWVDGSDPAWAAKKDFYMEKEPPTTKEGISPCRFRNHNELKYALRSINDFAPFVRYIFIVTDDQKPSWLKNHSKVRLVSHKEIFLEKKDLPSFNSSAIESHVHRIAGLSEKYVYCNDDFFLGRRVSPADFFTEDGKIKIFETEREIPSILTKDQSNDSVMRRAWNTSRSLKSVYGDDKRHFFLYHIPYVMRKSLVQKSERMFPRVFEKVSADRFRSANSYRITCCLIQYVGLYSDLAKQCHADYYFFPYQSNIACDRAHMKNILEKKPMFFCVQDEEITEIHEDAEQALTQFFETYFPLPAPWES